LNQFGDGGTGFLKADDRSHDIDDRLGRHARDCGAPHVLDCPCKPSGQQGLQESALNFEFPGPTPVVFDYFDGCLPFRRFAGGAFTHLQDGK
jgi:hypothetical protein